MAALGALLIVLISVLPTLYFVTYAMHCLLVVVQDTAAGNDEVTWPEERFQDTLGGAFHLAAVVLIWLAPIGILTRALRNVWLPDDPGLRFLLLAVPGLWIILPVAIFSSLSASSRWFVFRPVVVWNLLRLAPFTFIVYLLSAILAGLITALVYVTVFRGWIVVAPVAGVGTATAFLIYGRLLGRLGWRMGRLYLGNSTSIKKARPQAIAAVLSESQPPAPDEPPGPEELDSEWEITPYGQKRRRVKGYGMTRDALAQPMKNALPKVPAAKVNEPIAPDELDREWEVTAHGRKQRRTKSYGITQEPPSQSDAAPEDGITALNVPPPASITERPPASGPTDFDRVIRGRTRIVIGSQGSFLGGVFTFPYYRQTRIPWLLLSLGFLMVYGAACVLVSVYLTINKNG
ncbi:MAG TPA: hypothetical protein DDY78_17805 [Planctomycetales bacterium]|nr:hypothetical protein [Planctomycetales bacterium]